MLHSLPRFDVQRAAAAALFVLLLLSLRPALAAPSEVKLYHLPAEVRSTHYRVTINGRAADVMHAASSYYLVNFETDGPLTVSVTAEDPHFWDRGVEVQPMRLGIRPVRKGATITFPLAGPQKLTITRPGDHFADADMLFLFANLRESPPDLNQNPQIRYFGPGIHRENIDAKTGDRIYLDGGAVVLGSLNVWQVKDVRVFGQGTIIYDGPQDPHSDEGWMHKPNWHCIVMDVAQNIEVDGITCITRSRSWQIQMRDSRHIGFYNIKVIGGNPNDANQDGMDWLGGGDTTVKNSFFRASDDVFALQGNWDGYDLESMRRPGHDVTNITIEGTVASTSISNTIRVGWPEKTFNSSNFLMRDMDVIHTGFGACKVPFAFFELWADPNGQGTHENYALQNIRLEDWYSLFQIRQPAPHVSKISFREIWAMDSPAMVPSVLKGDVRDISLNGVVTQGFTPDAVDVQAGAESPNVYELKLDPSFSYTPGRLRAGQEITFSPKSSAVPGLHFEWLFGDGSRASGSQVKHRFPDARGTLLDGSGRFRVLLHLQRTSGEEAWGSQALLIGQRGDRRVGQSFPAHKYLASSPSRSQAVAFDVPVDGGYSFTLLTSTTGSLSIDDLPPVITPKGRSQVCGSAGNAVQAVQQSMNLAKGPHTLRVVRDFSLENAVTLPYNTQESPLVLWEGPGIPRQLLVTADP